MSGPAHQIVRSVPDGDDAYDVAKQLLSDAFSDKTLQQFSVIDRLLNLKLCNISDSFAWISEVRIIKEQIERLNIVANTFVQYFLWTGMSLKFKQQFMLTCNSSKPSLDDMINKSFEVFDRIKQGSAQTKKFNLTFPLP